MIYDGTTTTAEEGGCGSCPKCHHETQQEIIPTTENSNRGLVRPGHALYTEKLTATSDKSNCHEDESQSLLSWVRVLGMGLWMGLCLGNGIWVVLSKAACLLAGRRTRTEAHGERGAKVHAVNENLWQPPKSRQRTASHLYISARGANGQGKARRDEKLAESGCWLPPMTSSYNNSSNKS
ncbi:hypothetical protein ACLKA7_016897 [Drosophila subpalustris]